MPTARPAPRLLYQHLSPVNEFADSTRVIEYVADSRKLCWFSGDSFQRHVYSACAPVYAAPVRLAPAPVIEYIEPSPAVSYPSFFPSFSLSNEAITVLVNPQFSITADETSQVQVVVQEVPEIQVVERIKEQIVGPPSVTTVGVRHTSVGGELKDLPLSVTVVNVAGTSVVGELKDLPPSVTTVDVSETSVGGEIKDLPPSVTYVDVRSTSVVGDFEDLPASVTCVFGASGAFRC